MIVRALVCLVVAIGLTSCANYGGGTIGTGMSLGSGRSKKINTGISYVNLTGRLISALDGPIENAQIMVSTERSEETIETDFDGRFILTFVAKVGERVKVRVVNGKAVYNDSFIVDQQNINQGTATIKILGHGKLQISNLQWFQ